MGLIITILPVVTKDLPISPRFTPYDFLSRCKFGTLTTRQPIVEFYLLTFPRFPLRKKEHKSYFGKNRAHDFRTSRCAGYLLDHSGDELQPLIPDKAREGAWSWLLLRRQCCTVAAAVASYERFRTITMTATVLRRRTRDIIAGAAAATAV